MKFGKLSARLATRRFWLRLIGCVVLTMVVSVAGMRVYWRVQLNREIARIKAEGYPTTFEELNEFYPAVPDEDNMALILTNAFAQMDFELTEEEDELVPYLGSVYPETVTVPDEETANAIDRVLEHYQPAIELAYQAAQKRRSRFPRKVSADDLLEWYQHYARTKILLSALRLKSYQHLTNGETAKATECARVALRISNALESQPVTIAILVRMACVAVALENLQLVTATQPIAPAGLEDLRQELQWLHETTSATRAFAGEFAFILHAGYYNRSSLGGELGILPISDWTDPDELKGFAGYYAYRLAGLADPDLLFSLNRLSAAVEASKNDETAREFMLSGDARFEAELAEHDWYLGSKNFYAYFNLTDHLKRVLDQKRLLAAVDTALAVELFRRETGALPDSLVTLVPKFLNAVPTDYESGQPMRILGATNGFGVGTTTPLFQVRTYFTEPSPSPEPTPTSSP